MPRVNNPKDDDEEPLKAHRLLHRSCQGKAHGSGIAKTNNRRATPSTTSPKSPKTFDHFKSPGSSKNSKKFEEKSNENQKKFDEVDNFAIPNSPNFHPPEKLPRKLSKNSGSSLEFSDTDSFNSSETGLTVQNGFATPSRNCESSESGIAISRGNFEPVETLRTAKKTSPLSKTKSPTCNSKLKIGKKKENWADTLRSGSVDDKIKKMEEGWDDSNIIRSPKERKCQRIMADVEQKCSTNSENEFKLVNSKSPNGKTRSNSNKVLKRRSCGIQRPSKPICEVMEWEEIVEMALARKFYRGKRAVLKSIVEDVESEKIRKGKVNNNVGDEMECMKKLEVLLKNRVPPQNEEVPS